MPELSVHEASARLRARLLYVETMDSILRVSNSTGRRRIPITRGRVREENVRRVIEELTEEK